MKKPSEGETPSRGAPDDADDLRGKVLGLGERSARKTYYPMLRARLAELERFRVALDGSNDAIVLIEASRAVVEDANETACRMLGRPRGELVGRPLADVMPSLAPHLERARGHAGGYRTTLETDLRSAGGAVVPVEVTLSLVRIGHGCYATAVARDISERLRAERERELLFERERAARAEAERASRLKDDFVATISHELRTPLHAILGWTQLAGGPSATQERMAKGIAVIDRNARLLSQQVGDLLEVSRIASGKLRVDAVPVDLPGILDAALEGLRGAWEAKGITLLRSVEVNRLVVLGDPGRLQQVVSNLVSNAIKFTPRGGRIDVSLTRSAERAVLVVRDTGQGIEPDFLPLIFDRFRQADASMARRHGGLGLGLSIVKHVVELHGGVVRAQSAGRDQGACFTVELPLADPWPIAEGQAPEPQHVVERLDGVRVLVVEDEPDAREVVQRILEELGADVVLAASAPEALEALAAGAPDAVVSDIGLPGMNGFELMRRIRTGVVPSAAAVPAVALTAFARPEDRAQALLAGFQEHLAKPVEASALLAAVARLVRRDQAVDRRAMRGG